MAFFRGKKAREEERKAALAAEKRAKERIEAERYEPKFNEDGSIIKRDRVLLFYNPNSGNGLFKNNLDLIVDKFQIHHLQIVPVRAAHGYAIDMALREMDQTHYRQIIACGGDGTINTCVNAMIKYDIQLPLAIFPAGTANDFANYFNIPDKIEDMIDVALGDHFTTSDVGKVNDQYFINVTSIGSLGDVSKDTNQTLKNSLGVAAYYLKGVSGFLSMKPVKVKLTTPDAVYEEEMLFMVVMNGTTAGGFKSLSPESKVNDGVLDVVLFKKMPLTNLVPVFLKVLRGDHLSNDKVLFFSSETLKVETEGELTSIVDGEEGPMLPLEFSVVRNRLKIFTAENEMHPEK